MISKLRYRNAAEILIILVMLFQLTACGGGGGGSAGNDGGVEAASIAHTIEGSIVDGPIVDATVNVYASDGTLVHTTTSDSSARYSANFQVDKSQYPLTIEVVGGIDLVTRRAPDFDLLSVVTGPESDGVININPFTTVATEMARRMKGGLNKANVESAKEVVLEQLNFGLDKELVPDPFHTDVSKDNAAVIVRASEALGEMLRRTHNNLTENGLSSDMDDTMHLLAGDLVDGVLNGSGSDDDRVAATFKQVSSQVLTEAMRNELKVDGVDATSALDDSILQLQPDTPYSKLTSSVPVNREMLIQARTVGVVVEDPVSTNMPSIVPVAPPTVETVGDPAAADPVVGDNSGNTPDGTTTVTLPQTGSGTVKVPVKPDPAQEPKPAINSAPQLSGSPRKNLKTGETYSFRPAAIDADGDTLTFTIKNRPAWSSFNNTTGQLFGTPKSSDTGVTGGIIITVSDGISTDEIGPFSIRVNEVTVATPAEPVAERKYHPGHYISLLRRFDSQKIMLDSVRPGVVGFLKRYPWRDLEPSLGNYDFSEVESDLALVASQGMQLIIMIEDKTFTADTEKPLPPYLSTVQYSMPNRKSAYTAVRWSPYVVTRLNALIAALGQRFDAHPNFEGIMPTEESAPSVNRGVLDAAGYTPEKYRDAMIAILNGAAQSFPTSRVFWYMNFLPQHQGYLGDIADAVKANGVVLGGPDMLPDDHALVKNTYPIYDELKGQLPMYGHISGACYRHLHKDASAPTKYWTMDELFTYSRNRMDVNYMFWVRLTRPSPSDAYDWTDALPVIANNPVFSQ